MQKKKAKDKVNLKKSEAKDLVLKKDYTKLKLAMMQARAILKDTTYLSQKTNDVFYSLLSKGLKIDEVLKEIRTFDNQRDIAIELVKKAKVNKKMKGETK